MLSGIVIGVASTAPGYSLAASLGLVVAAVGLQAPAIMFLAFLPMLFIAAAYYYLNRADPDCGTTFAWVTRAIGPHAGWMGGWGIIVADIIVMANLAQIAGEYTFLLFNADGLAENVFWVTLLGCVFIAVLTWVCYVGIEASARTQYFLLRAEIVTLVIFSMVALGRVWFGDVRLSWLNRSLYVSVIRQRLLALTGDTKRSCTTWSPSPIRSARRVSRGHAAARWPPGGPGPSQPRTW
jgi:amino acid transporter